MNYSYQYKQLIRSRKKLQSKRKQDKKNGVYFEEHHIILKCFLKHKPKIVWNGSWNRIQLTAREHFIAHMLLWKACKQIYGDNHQHTIKCMYAVNNFTIRKASDKADYKINSRIYEILKKKFSETQSIIFYQDDTYPIKNYWKNKKFSREHRKNISMSISGKNHPSFNKVGVKSPTSKYWEIYYTDGTKEIVKGLKDWCIKNCYSYSAVRHVFNNRQKNHRDIIKVGKLPNSFKP